MSIECLQNQATPLKYLIIVCFCLSVYPPSLWVPLSGLNLVYSDHQEHYVEIKQLFEIEIQIWFTVITESFTNRTLVIISQNWYTVIKESFPHRTHVVNRN